LAGSAGLPEKETARAPIQLSTRISGHAINPPPRIRAGSTTIRLSIGRLFAGRTTRG
jgi:hypothetical protein